jgi:hypothetical protein
MKVIKYIIYISFSGSGSTTLIVSSELLSVVFKTVSKSLLSYRVRIRLDSHCFWKPDPDSHEFKIQKLSRLKMEPLRALDAQNRGVEA